MLFSKDADCARVCESPDPSGPAHLQNAIQLHFQGGGFFQLRFFILDIFPCSQFIPDHFVPSHSLTELSKLCGGQMVREASRCLFFGARLLSLDHLFSAGLPGQKE